MLSSTKTIFLYYLFNSKILKNTPWFLDHFTQNFHSLIIRHIFKINVIYLKNHITRFYPSIQGNCPPKRKKNYKSQLHIMGFRAIRQKRCFKRYKHHVARQFTVMFPSSHLVAQISNYPKGILHYTREDIFMFLIKFG